MILRHIPIAAFLLLSAVGCATRTPAPVLAAGTLPDVRSQAGRASSTATAGAATDAGSTDTSVPVSGSELVQRAASIFAEPSASAGSGPMDAAARATWDIDVRSYETHSMVSQYIGIFTGRARGYMERSMSRGTRYDAMLRRKFRESGLPEDMTYLALIESSYMPHAYSRAAAVGMWQFMAPTARGVGMRVDWWVDERRDPMRSTQGAIDFLTDLHDAYGSWYLAAAAYNGGPGRVSRGLKRFSEEMDGSEGEDRFFALAEQKYLPSETKEYVPRLIAAAMVAKEPVRYGLRVDTLPEFSYDSVNVPAGTALGVVARAAGVPVETITDLNPHFLRGITPPDGTSEVRLPIGVSPTFAAAFALVPAAERLGWSEVRYGSPRSLQAVAEMAGVPAKAIRWMNPRLSIDRRGRIPAGVMVRIPTALAVVAARDVPDPSLVRTSSSGGSLVAKRVRVRSGESLSSVARRSGISVAQLRKMNGLKSSRVRAGQMLVVRRPSRSAVLAARRTAAARNPRSMSVSAGPQCKARVVTVKGKRRTVTACPAAKKASAARRPASGSRSRSATARSSGASANRRSAASTRRTASPRVEAKTQTKSKPKTKPKVKPRGSPETRQR